MKINWKQRLRNPVFIVSLSTLVISFTYTLLSAFDIIPKIGQQSVLEMVDMLVKVLAMLGIVVDPTTPGINDSARAMTYGTDMDVRKDEANA